MKFREKSQKNTKKLKNIQEKGKKIEKTGEILEFQKKNTASAVLSSNS